MSWWTKGMIIFVMVLLEVQPLSGQERLVFSTFLDPQPFFLVGERVLQEAYTRLGIQVEIHRFPGERSIKSANSGLTDGELGRIAGIERVYPNLVMVSTPITMGEPIVFTHNVSLEIKGWKSLKPYLIGYVRGTKVVENHTQGMKRMPVTTMAQAFKMLVADRIDMVVEDRVGGIVMARQLGLKNILVVEPPLLTVPIYHYLHQKHQKLIPRLEEVLRKMAQAQEIDAIKEAVMLELAP